MSSRADCARLFLALFPDPAIRRRIVALQQSLALKGRPVAPQNLHLTLVFLGDVPLSRQDELQRLGVAHDLPVHTLRLDQVAGFSRAGVAYLGPSEPPGTLESFRHTLAERLSLAGFAYDQKSWHPHLTLYRHLRKPCPRISVEPVIWSSSAYCLVSSRLTQAGPEYRVLSRWGVAG